MPIIGKIGARGWRVRAVYTCIYVALVLGAVSMLYPMTLMLSGSVKSDTDFVDVSPIPRFWFDDNVLFQKYCESKYNLNYETLQSAWGDHGA